MALGLVLAGGALMQGYFGLYRGTVVSAADPEQSGRLLLQVPSVTGFRQSGWAQPSRPSGLPVQAPAPGDPVWVQYEGGNTSRPVWVGIPATVGDAGGAFSFSDLTVTGTVTLPAGSLPIATTAGLQAALDSKYSAANPPPAPAPPDLSGYVTLAGAQTITGTKTFSAASPSLLLSSTRAAEDSTVETRMGGIDFYQHYGLNRAAGITAQHLFSRDSWNNSHLVFDINGVERLRLSAGGAVFAGTVNSTSAGGFQRGRAFLNEGELFIDASGDNTNRWRITSAGAINYLQTDGLLRLAAPYDGAKRVDFGTDGSIDSAGQIRENGVRVYSASNPPPAPDLSGYVTLASAQTISGAKTFSTAPVVPDSSFTIAKTTGLQTALDAKVAKAGDTMTGQLNVTADAPLGGTTGTSTNQGLRSGSRGLWATRGGVNGSQYLTDNAYYDGSVWRSIAASTNRSLLSLFSNGSWELDVANPPGAANATLTWATLCSIDPSGNFSAVGQLKEGSVRVYSPNNPPPASGMSILSATTRGAFVGNGSWYGVNGFTAPSSGRVKIVFHVHSNSTGTISFSLDGGTTQESVSFNNTGSGYPMGQMSYNGLTPGGSYTLYAYGAGQGISIVVEG